MSKLNGIVKKLLEFAFGIVVSVFILYFTVRSLGSFNPSELFSDKVKWWLAIFSGLVFDSATFSRGLAYTRGIETGLNWFKSWRITAVGNAANMVLPFKMGEGLRLALFPKRYSAAKRAELLFIPGMADIGVILLFGILAVFFAGFDNPRIVALLKTLTLLFLIACLITAVIILSVHKTNKALRARLNKATLKMTFWVFLSWLLMLVSIWLGFLAFGYGIFHSIKLSLASFASMNFVMLIPSSPGGIGLFEYSVIFGLSGLGIAETPAKAVGLLLHLTQYAALLPLGIILYFIGTDPVEKRLAARKNILFARKFCYNNKK